jgi:hypothetical protein
MSSIIARSASIFMTPNACSFPQKMSKLNVYIVKFTIFSARMDKVLTGK